MPRLRDRRALVGAIVLAILVPVVTVRTDRAGATTGPVAAYSFDAGSGSTLIDVTGRGHTGTITNATWSSTGRTGGALSFNGTNAWVTITDAADLRAAPGFTYEAWVRPASLSGWRTILMKERPGGFSQALYASDNSSQPPAGYVNTGAGDVSARGTTALALNTWTHVATSYDGATLRTFVGGVQVGSRAVSGTPVASGSPLRIGGNSVWGEYFSGLIDEVRIYDRALTAAEITTDLNAPVADSTPPASAVTAPADGATVTGLVRVSMSASDASGVAGVQLLVDGVATGDEDTTAPYEVVWDTRLTAEGPHDLTARARDGSGNLGTSVPVRVTVARSSDTAPPAIAITAPTEGASLTNTVTITAAASDTGGVFDVQLTIDGSPFGPLLTSEPYSLPWNTVGAGAGAHVVSAVARDNAGNATTAAAVNVTVVNQDPRATTGEWSAPVATTGIMQHAVLMPNSSRILYFEDGAGAQVLNALTATSTPVPLGVNLFCAGQALLPDGRPFVIGGDDMAESGAGLVNTYAFSPSTNTWTRLTDMHYRRWYPTATMLPDGRELAMSGSSGGCNTCFVQTPEVYDPVANTWTTHPEANKNIEYYPFNYVMPDGRVVVTGASEVPSPTYALDPRTWTWSTVDGRTIDGASAAMFTPGKVIKAGTASDGNSAIRPAVADAWVLDMSAPTPSWRPTNPMANPRAFLNLTNLPDQTVLATGGMTRADGTSATTAVKAAELWSPATEQWTTLASEARPRSYHSTALLLPDARVLVGGGGNDGNVPSEPNYEIFSPPYLFKGPRPTITSAPAQLAYGQSFDVTTPDASRVASAVLIAPAAVTHAFDEHSRIVPLTVSQGSGVVHLQAPPNGALAPPGSYMLFLVDGNGVPSVASWTRFAAPWEDAVPPGPVASLSATGGLGQASLSWSAATDNVGVVKYAVHRSTTPGFTPSAADEISQPTTTTYVDTGRPAGTYYYRVEAIDAAGNRGPASPEAVAVVTADATAPTVAVSAPSGGDTVSGTIAVSAAAGDNVGVAGVQFRVDGAALGAEDTIAPYSVNWNTATAANGTHVLTAVARDAVGNSTTSAPVTVMVSNSAPPPAAGLMAAYNFDQGSGLTLTDRSGRGHDGAISGATWSTGGHSGGALSFNGTSSWVTVADHPDLDLTTGLTLEAWVLATNRTGWRSILMKELPSEMSYALYASGSPNRPSGYFFIGGAERNVTGTTALTLSTWVHLAVTYDGAAMKLYVNGTQVASAAQTGAITTSANPFRIGGDAVWGEYFAGLIDDVRIYNRALTAAEIGVDRSTPVG